MYISKSQKLAFFLLTTFTITGIVLGFQKIYNNIYGQFKTEGEVKSFSDITEQSKLQALEYTLSLQTTDTDKDGISDYDEQYNYNTSPYISDTDSDGIDDKTELQAGTDPTCHKDIKDCGVSVSPPVVETPSVEEEFLNQLPSFEDSTVTGVEPFGGGQNIDEDVIKNMDSKTLRSLLLESGFPKEQLDKLSDEELMETWGEVFK